MAVRTFSRITDNRMRRLFVILMLSVIVLCSLPIDLLDAYSDVQQTYQTEPTDVPCGDISYVIVYYDANGGTCSKKFDTVKVGESITLPTAERSGYVFKNWINASGALLASSSGVPYFNDAGDTVSPKETVYLVASWEEKSITDTVGDYVKSLDPMIIVSVIIGIVVLIAVATKFAKK